MLTRRPVFTSPEDFFSFFKFLLTTMTHEECASWVYFCLLVAGLGRNLNSSKINLRREDTVTMDIVMNCGIATCLIQKSNVGQSSLPQSILPFLCLPFYFLHASAPK